MPLELHGGAQTLIQKYCSGEVKYICKIIISSDHNE